jgi:hypothetical protein
MARYRELALTLRRIGRAMLNWVRFGKYEHGLRALGPPSFALIELGSVWQKYAALLWQPEPSGFSIRSINIQVPRSEHQRLWDPRQRLVRE